MLSHCNDDAIVNQWQLLLIIIWMGSLPAMPKLPSCFPPIVMIVWNPLVCPTTGWTGPEEEAHRSPPASRALIWLPRLLNGPPGLLRDNADVSTNQVSPPSVSVSSPVLRFKAFPLLLGSHGLSSKQYWALSYSLLYVCACQSFLGFLLPGWLSESYLCIKLCVGQNVRRTR